MGTFFDKLMSAYYSTPLPEESDQIKQEGLESR